MPLNIDYNYSTNIMIPYKKRTIERYDWMRLQSFPLVDLNTRFGVDLSTQTFAALHSSQVILYEHYLNSVLTLTFPITITDGTWLDETYIYIRGELFSEPTYVYTRAEAATPLYTYTQGEFGIQQVDFIVNLSGSDAGLETKLRSYVESFKPAGKIYVINKY